MMGFRHGLGEIGNAADIPQLTHHGRAAYRIADGAITHQGSQGQTVIGLHHQGQIITRRGLAQASQQGGGGLEFQPGITPMQTALGGETVVLHQLHHFIAHGDGSRRGAKGAGIHVPARPARNLPDFRRTQFPMAQAVELALSGKGDMVNIHVQAHADGIGGDQIVDLASLIQSRLGIAGARAERTHYHSRAAALTAHQFGQGVHISGREGDDGAAAGQTREFLFTAIRQDGKTRPFDEFSFGQ